MQNVEFFPDFLFVICAASTPWAWNNIALTVKQNRLYKPRAMKGGRERAASGPRQGRKNPRSPSDWANLAKIFHIEHFRAMQILRS